MKFDFSFWNYSKAKTWNYSAIETVRMWKELGITIGFSFQYSGDEKQKMTDLISECEAENIQLIVYDERVFWHSFRDEKSYVEAVRSALKDFGNSSAVLGFYLGDEPSATQFEAFKVCYKLFSGVSSKLGFINLCYNDALAGTFGGRESYLKFLKEFVKDAGIKVISNDRYSSMHITEFYDGFKEIGIEKYFADLNMFKELAKFSGEGSFWTSLLSVGHWMYRTPSRGDIRWQMSTACAHGATCLQWFFLYQHRFADDYYDYPIELSGSKTQLYEDIKNETFQFKNKILAKLEGYEFDEVFHITKSYGATRLLEKASDCSLFVRADHGQNGILTRFKNAQGMEKFMVTNNAQTTSELFHIEYKNAPNRNYFIWLPVGGTHIVEGKEFV